MATLDEVYCKFGEVSEAAQLLETELGNILIMTKAAEAGLLDASNPEAALEICKGIDSQTLGKQINFLNKSSEDASHLSDLLAEALKAQNRLAHSFYRQHNFRRN